MFVNARDALMKLSPETLVNALLELASHEDHAADLVERLISSPKENLSRFEQKLTELRKSRRCFDWGGGFCA